MDAKIEAFKGLDTSTVSDALDRLGLVGQCFGIRPLDRGFSLCGRAYTIRVLPVIPGTKGAGVGEYIDDVPPGEVVVLDNRGVLDTTVWGDILTIMANRRGIGGTVIHGVCRDTPRSLELNYPIFSRGTYMRTGKDRVHVDAYNAPVSLGEVRITPGDLLLGDSDGLVMVPQDKEEEVLAAAREIDEAEALIRKAVTEEGIRLDEARKRYRYSHLQSRKT